MPSKKNDSMYEQYFTLLDNYKKKFGEKVMLFYQVGTFYEVYGLYDDKRNAYLDQYNDSNNLNKILECHVALKKNVRYKGYVLSTQLILSIIQPSIIEPYNDKLIAIL